MQDFLQNLAMVGVLLLIGVGAVAWYIIRHYDHLAKERRRTETAKRKREDALTKQEENKALLLSRQADIAYNELAMRQFQMQLAAHVQQQGGTFEWTQHGFRASGVSIKQIDTSARPQIAAPVTDETPRIPALPTNVRYEDVRPQVPKGHVLVGVGRLGVETKDAIVGACLWIVGLSGTGKTSTTVLRVEERAAEGHKFLGADPHWFKPESLTNAVTAYANLFVQPMARTPQEIKSVLAFFLQEFKERKAGHRPKPWQRITLLVDEVGSLMDATDEDEEEVKAMLPSIARICGQEGRNFGMGGIFISQQATGLAWLRKVALMIIVHQLLMDNEKKLATNNDTDAMEDMKSWCIGRTYVYGVGFTDGARIVQQPYFEPASRVVESNPPSQMEDLQPKNTSPLQEQRVRNTTSPSRPFLRVVEVDTEGEHEVATEAVSKGREGEKEQIFLSEREIQIGNMFFGERKMSPTAIAKELWPDVTGGTAFQKNAQIINEAIRKYASQMKVGA